jgi:hypothetical protein
MAVNSEGMRLRALSGVITTFCISRALVLAIMLCLSIVPAISAELRFEDAFIERGNIKEGLRSFDYDGKGISPAGRIAISNKIACSGHKAIVYDIAPTRNRTTDGTDKSMNWITSDRRDFLGFNETRYFGFTIYIPAEHFAESNSLSEAPIIWQVWQGSPFGPAIFARLWVRETEDTAQLHFFAKNDRTSPYPSATPLPITKLSIAKNSCVSPGVNDKASAS